jgi:hypothetical protein
VAINHNAIGRGYETFGNTTADTVERVLDPERERYTGKPVTEPDWYRTSPPPRKFKWSLRNNTNYMQTGVLSALQYTALHGKDMLRRFWQRGANAVRRGRTEKPYAIAIPEKQDDPRRLAEMLNLLRAHGIEVHRATQDFKVAEGSYPAGTFLVRMDQPYRGYALDLLTPQKYPADKAPYDPYDDVSWALPVALGLEVKTIADESVRGVASALLAQDFRPAGRVSGEGAVYLLKDTGQEGLLAARARLARFKVEAAEKAFSHAGAEYPAGSWIVAAQPGLASALDEVAKELALEFTAAGEAPSVPRHPLDLPRLALLQSWDDTESAGWLRMIFDDQKIPYTLIMDEDVRRGGLRQRFDVIVFPNTYASLTEIVTGMDPKHGPLAYTKTPEFPSHGTPTSSPDITGGFTWAGVGNLEQYVRSGGLLLTLGGASTLPLDGGIARDVRRARVTGVDTPGSELRVRFRRPDHPIAYGYKETTSVFREQRPLYAVRRVDQARVVLQWGTTLPREDDPPADEDDKDEKKDALVVSGGIKGASEVEGKAALLDIPTGQGRVVAFDFDPIHRYQTWSDFRLAWNVILNWNDLPR